MDELERLIDDANKVYKENFPNTTWFERALFFSWSCSIRDCKFCYMSVQQTSGGASEEKAVRSKESLFAEAILCKNLGWRIGFFSGGMNAYPHKDILEILKVINHIIGENVWLNIGAVSKSQLEKYTPHIKGVVGSIETINEKLHREICPSKPLKPYIKMFKDAHRLGLKNSMTIILGLGETKDDFETLKEFIINNHIEKIHIYALNPVVGTVFENKKSPEKEYQAWYIANLRIAFPKIDIQMGIWKNKIDRVSLLLNAGANSISKFPITKSFGSLEAKEIELQARAADREFLGSLTKIPDINWDREVELLPVENDVKAIVKKKLCEYLKNMNS
ncbi:MAG: radical SAM protein [Nanoarchaeota archaeon]|nr:radical SAM protein [Nanoarchaeota archaeon]MBU1270455.1 radical SAM protein [Nanoarchaeota archaeon]MBU2442515.1 radical SAM protein [Nanoarchaeota archaeon]